MELALYLAMAVVGLLDDCLCGLLAAAWGDHQT